MIGRRHFLAVTGCAALPFSRAAAQSPPISAAASAQTLAASTGYRVEFDAYAGPGPLALVLMHGKNSFNRVPNMRAFAEKIAAAGTTVLVPNMPWGRAWNGTADDAKAAVDALVAHAAASGKRVVVGGLSLGATFAMVWRPADPPPAVVAKAFLNPGGLLDMTPPTAPFWRRVTPEVERAKALEAAGQGRVAVRFTGSNAVGESFVEESYTTTPEIYLSFHDTARFPSVRAALPSTRLPVFWSSGTRDPTASAKRRSFDMLIRNPASVYLEPEGDHNSAFVPAADPLIGWLRANFARG